MGKCAWALKIGAIKYVPILKTWLLIVSQSLDRINGSGISGIPPRPPCVTLRRVAVSLRGPGQPPVLPFTCCAGSMLSVGRGGRCSCWCCFQWLAHRGLCWLLWGAFYGKPPPPPLVLGRTHSVAHYFQKEWDQQTMRIGV